MAKTPSSRDIRAHIQFHDALNSLVWDDTRMRMEVRVRLMRAALAFYRFVDVPRLVVRDIVLTGSNAAYNYTRQSDLDVHLIVDFKATSCPGLAENVFTTKKALWAETYDITIHDMAVELYVEDSAKPAKSNGRYSILQGEWIDKATSASPSKNDSSVVSKVKYLSAEIDGLIASKPSNDQVTMMFARLRSLRQNGLLNGGEFSAENLAYKALRALGYLDRLFDASKRSTSDDLSL